MFENRIAKYLKRTANLTPQGSGGEGFDMPVETKPKARIERTEFGNRFARVMARAGLTTPQLIETALERKWTARQVSYLYTADYQSATDPKETGPLLAACAGLAKTTVDAFFTDEPLPESKPAASGELIDMVAKALDGPKAEFLADAIEMAYAAAVTGKTNYKRHS